MSAKALLRRKLWRDLGRRRAQVIAVGLTVMVGVAVFVVTAAMASNLSDSYDLSYEQTSFADVWITGGADDLLGAIEAMDGVDRVEVRTSAEIGVRFDDRPIRTRIVGFGPETSLNQLVITAGTGLDSAEGEAVELVLEQHTADHFQLGPGDTVDIDGIGEASVIGVATSPEWLWVAPNQQELVVDPDEFGVVFAPEALAAQAAPDAVPQVVVGVGDEKRDEVVEQVEAAAVTAGAGEVLTRANHPSNQALQSDLEGFEQISVMFPVLFLGAAGLATAVLVGRLVAQQRAEIGMLQANGYPVSTIQRHFASYGVVIALLGAIPGVPLGVVGGWAATEGYTDFLGIPFASRQLQPWIWVVGVIFAGVVGAASGGVAARRATAVEPADAMRPGGSQVVGRRSRMEWLVPAGSPNWVRLAVRNLGRAPGRAATTAVGMILALVLTMTALVLNDTIDGLFSRQFSEVDLRSLVVALDRPVDDDTIALVQGIDGVAVAEPHSEIGVSLVSGSGVVAERLQVMASGTALHGFGDSDTGDLPAEGLVISAIAADKLGVGVGDQVELRALDGTSGSLVVASTVAEPMAGSSYVSVAAWEAIGGDVPRLIAVGLHDRDDHEAVRAELAALDGVTQISDRVATADRVEALLAGSRFFVAVVLLLAVVMAVALIFNALAVTIGERETEVATLSANGVGRGWIRRAITAENLMTVGMGLIPGLVIGRISAGLFVSQFSTDQFRFDPVLRPWSLVGTALLLAVCALVAQLPGLRRLDRLDLAAKVRERAL
jgi:putative ABC transport system permease protein